MESTPHMHLGIVPMRDGKLSSKAMFDREELKKIQDELPQYLNEQGFELERGQEIARLSIRRLLNLSKKWLVRKSRNS